MIVRFGIFLPLTLCIVLTACLAARAQQNSPPSRQVLREDGGGIFMEEVDTPPKKPDPHRPTRPQPRQQTWKPGYRDFEDAGVKVDSTGQIIPLIQKQGGPVMPEFSETTAYDEPWWWFAPPASAFPYSPWGVPYASSWAAPFAFPGISSYSYYPGGPIPPIGPVGPRVPIGPVGPVGPARPVGPIPPMFPYVQPWLW